MKRILFLIASLLFLATLNHLSYAATLLSDDFESYAPGSSLAGQGGWYQSSQATAPMILGVGSGLGSIVADGGIRTGDGTYTNNSISSVLHSLSGPLNPSSVYTFSVDAYAFSAYRSHVASMSFISADGTFSIIWYSNWYGSPRGTPKWSFAMSGVGNIGTFPGGFDQPIGLEIIIDGLANEVYGRLIHSGGVFETAHQALTATQIASLTDISLNQDFRDIYLGAEFDNILVIEIPQNISVVIDIKPGSDDNPVNLKSKGVIPVAVLTTDDFDAATVNGATVTFAGASPDHGSGHLEDVDGDGDLDWLGHFRMQETNIAEEDTEATLSGETTDGTPIVGSDGITIPKGSGKGKAGKLALANSPNPFNPATTITYDLPEAAEVQLVIYNTLGQAVRTLVHSMQSSGRHSVVWDGRDAVGREVTSGVYFYRIVSMGRVQTNRMLLLK